MTRAVVEAIPDGDLRELERVMPARALLGIPVCREIIFYSGSSSISMGSEPGYDD